jgi:hypothetical protein
MSDTIDIEMVAQHSAKGAELARTIMYQLDGINSQIALNMLASMLQITFTAMPFEQPGHLLEEFDHWAAHVRQRMTDIVKERTQ